ncbi:putative FAD-binding domain-containing protein [Seiridium cardinale]
MVNPKMPKVPDLVPEMARQPSTGIKAIIIGAGFAGLGAAIECVRQGHEVEVFEQARDFTALGDLIVLTPNGTRIVGRWGDCLRDIMERCIWTDILHIRRTDGTLLHDQPWQLEYEGFPFAMGQRSHYQKVLVDFAKSLGIKFNMASRVEEYFETDSGAGIVVNGVKHTADVVLGADGIHSRCRTHVTGAHEKVQGSGYAVFRAWFSLSEVKDPMFKELRLDQEDTHNLWIGPDTHGFILTCPNLDMVVYAITHLDKFHAQESYSHKANIENVLETCDGWDPRFRAVVQATPPDRIVDWKLLWRDPIKQWVSPQSHVALLGDAAHPFLPTSGNGAVQALEDGATLAVLLRLAGKNNIPIALKAFETLRYERVTLCQRIGFETRHNLHKTNWEKYAQNPSSINLPQPGWQYSHDAEAYAVERWNDVLSFLRDDDKTKKFESKNVADGHVHTDWTVAELMQLETATVQ